MTGAKLLSKDDNDIESCNDSVDNITSLNFRKRISNENKQV